MSCFVTFVLFHELVVFLRLLVFAARRLLDQSPPLVGPDRAESGGPGHRTVRRTRTLLQSSAHGARAPPAQQQCASPHFCISPALDEPTGERSHAHRTWDERPATKIPVLKSLRLRLCNFIRTIRDAPHIIRANLELYIRNIWHTSR